MFFDDDDDDDAYPQKDGQAELLGWMVTTISVHRLQVSVMRLTMMRCLCHIVARQKCSICLGAPWPSISVEKNMPSIKFYHDFSAGKNQTQFLKNLKIVLGFS